MDSSEMHYITYDPEEIYKEMQTEYIRAGGDVLYPGDEKEMLLRAFQAILVQAFAGVDHALRMATLRYATGDYLDTYGENRGCCRLEAQKATAGVEMQVIGSSTETIEAGTVLTADGVKLYTLDEAIELTGEPQVITAAITASEGGSAWNGLQAGTQMQFLVSQPDIAGVYCCEGASGGQNREDDETYRERIRLHGLTSTTTGPASQYESAAKGVSSGILDAKAVNMGAGRVGIALIIDQEAERESLLEAVEQTLSAEDTRPLTDELTVFEAESVHYTLNIRCQIGRGSNAATFIPEVVAEYQSWQDNSIGRAFNPDRLVAALYQIGVARVILDEGSEFNGEAAQYTQIGATQRTKGTILTQTITP